MKWDIMFGALRKRFVDWVDEKQRQEISQLKKESQRLGNQIEQATGQPARLQPQEMRLLAKKAKGMSFEQVQKVSVLHPEDLKELIKEIESADDPTSKPM